MPSLRNMADKLRWSLAQRGVAGTLRVLAERVTDKSGSRKPPPPHPFDLKHGLDTGGFIGGGDLTAGHPHDRYITGYAGIPPSRFHASLQRWSTTPPVAALDSYTFVDIGCGKGRAVLLATQLHFREVIGVELNADLARIAETNLTRWIDAGKGDAPARIVQGDATEFALPPGPCLVYLANPFGAPVMHRFLDRLAARRDPAPLDLLYQNPEQADVLATFPRLQLLWSDTIPFSGEDAAADIFYSPTDRCNLYRLT